MTVTVRQGTDADRDIVISLGRKTLDTSTSSYREVIPELLEASYVRLLNFAFAQSNVLFIAEDGKERLGFLLMLDQLPDEVSLTPQAFVVYMAVEEHARRRGVAAAMITAAETWAREHNLPVLTLMVTEENLGAVALYRRFGFVTERRVLCKIL